MFTSLKVPTISILSNPRALLIANIMTEQGRRHRCGRFGDHRTIFGRRWYPPYNFLFDRRSISHCLHAFDLLIASSNCLMTLSSTPETRVTKANMLKNHHKNHTSCQTYEPPHGKTNNLHRRKQRRRSASR